jgi:hypothetical protein
LQNWALGWRQVLTPHDISSDDDDDDMPAFLDA